MSEYNYAGETYRIVGTFTDGTGKTPLVISCLASTKEPKQPFLAQSVEITGTQVYRISNDRWEATNLPPMKGEPPAWAVSQAWYAKTFSASEAECNAAFIRSFVVLRV
ncbi:hypothetical protein S7335_1169 [Synechococcus sp. PCC 7335]|uniref:hypothetical protein n=1 Tax=Synechococcus sp. (strain ATCC 29403 / PCC 7335) TaxID=91464 RepID=UPI00017EB572|nr:hypothetical protein [Synechococcus sp. PCC 7335]EDX82465.1 hypothetical protein S7335_1169 [Synechococcus sp. PCC 7335]